MLTGGAAEGAGTLAEVDDPRCHNTHTNTKGGDGYENDEANTHTYPFYGNGDFDGSGLRKNSHATLGRAGDENRRESHQLG